MCLSDPPLGSRNPDTLQPPCSLSLSWLLLTIIRALTGCPDNKMKDAVEALSPPQQTLLMQYIYRGMAQRSEASPPPLLHPTPNASLLFTRGSRLFPASCSSGTPQSLPPPAKAASSGSCPPLPAPSSPPSSLSRSAMSARPTVLDLPSMPDE